MIVNTLKFGGTASHITIGKIAHGLMMMTLNGGKVGYTDEDAFAAIKAGVDAMPPGVKMMLNTAEFYGRNLSTANIDLLARFYEKYPEYADKTFISVKGGMQAGRVTPDSSPENLRRSVDAVIEKLRGTKRIDLFETARVDPNVPIEDAIRSLVKLKEEGKFDHIGMSECKAETLRRAHQVHPIAVVEIEVSLWAYEEETRKVIETAKELGIVVAAYSPLGGGVLSGNIKTISDLPEGDYRRRLGRYQEENFKTNLIILDVLKSIAARKGVTPAQLAIAWVAALGPHVVPLSGATSAGRVLENVAAGDVELSKADLDEIADVLTKHEVKGGRYFGDDRNKVIHLWG